VTPAEVISAVEVSFPRCVNAPAWCLSALLLMLGPCGTPASPCACDVLSKISQLPDGPAVSLEAVEKMILRDWWKSDMRLTNLLFSVLRKAMASQVLPSDAGALVRICCDVIRGTFGRGTRFFLQVLADLMLFCGASQREELVMAVAVDLTHTAIMQKLNQAVGEHDVPIVAAAVGVVERMFSHARSQVDVSLLQRFVSSGAAGVSLVSQLLALPAAAAFSHACGAALLSCLLEQSALHCDLILEDVSLFQQLYVGMACAIARLPQNLVESWLWQNVLTPHVVSAQILCELWCFVLRTSANVVQIRHLNVLVDCFTALAPRRLCQRRVSAIIGCAFLSCSAAAQNQIASGRPDVLCHVPPSPRLCQEAVNVACCQIGPTAAMLTSDASVVTPLAAFCRIGGHQLTHLMAAPLAQSVREIYLRLGASSSGVSVREQRAAVLLVSSLAMWIRPDELRKFLGRMLQTRSISPAANVALLGRLAASVDGSCVDAAAAILSAAFSQKDWAVHVLALQGFRLLSTECALLDGGMIGQLAGPSGSKQNEAILAFLSIASRSVKCELSNILQAQAAAAKTQLSPAVTASERVSPNEFASLSMALVNTVKALQNCDSGFVLSDRFQMELTQCIAVLQTMKKK
jgi:hypothetical protein